MILLSRAEEILLIAIWKLSDDAYGVTIRERIFKDIGHYWSFGVIYKTLKKMTGKGFVRKEQSEPLSERGGRSKYFYRLAPQGVKALNEIKEIHANVWDGVSSLVYKEKY